MEEKIQHRFAPQTGDYSDDGGSFRSAAQLDVGPRAVILEGEFARLRPVAQNDYAYLYDLSLSAPNNARWRYRGATPSPERFAGDGVMVIFNDPLPCPDHAERAVKMAVAMRTSIQALAQNWRKQGHQLGVGFGVAQGYATLGPIGFEGRFDYGAIGTVVNLASRLSDAAADGQILISEPVRVATENVAQMESRGELSLKGLHNVVTAYNVIALDR